MRSNLECGGIVAPNASPARTMCSTAFALSTGSAPGSAKQTGQTLVFGSPPKAFGQPQNILIRSCSSTWHSIPITASYLASSSGVTATLGETVVLMRASTPAG